MLSWHRGESLYIAIVLGRNNFLQQTLLQWSWWSLQLKSLCCLTSRCIMLSSLCNILLSKPSSARANPLHQFVQFLSVTGSDTAATTDGCKEKCTCKTRLVKVTQHLAAHIEEPKLPQEVESALFLPVDGLSVTDLVVVNINMQVSGTLHHLRLFSPQDPHSAAKFVPVRVGLLKQVRWWHPQL